MSPKHLLILKKVAVAACFFLAIFIITRIALHLGAIANATTVAFSFLILVVLAAVFAGLEIAIAVSIISTLCYNYYFLPPVGTFRIADFDNWVALFVFLFTSILISRLTASSREHSRESDTLRLTIGRLKEFGTWLLSIPREKITLSGIAEEALRIFQIQYCSIHVYTEGKWHHFTGAAPGDLSQKIEGSLKFAEDHPTSVMQLIDEHALGVRYAQIQRDTKPLALFVVKSEYLPANAIGTLAYMVGMRLVEIVEP